MKWLPWKRPCQTGTDQLPNSRKVTLFGCCCSTPNNKCIYRHAEHIGIGYLLEPISWGGRRGVEGGCLAGQPAGQHCYSVGRRCRYSVGGLAPEHTQFLRRRSPKRSALAISPTSISFSLLLTSVISNLIENREIRNHLLHIIKCSVCRGVKSAGRIPRQGESRYCREGENNSYLFVKCYGFASERIMSPHLGPTTLLHTFGRHCHVLLLISLIAPTGPSRYVRCQYRVGHHLLFVVKGHLLSNTKVYRKKKKNWLDLSFKKSQRRINQLAIYSSLKVNWLGKNRKK